jgi:hypothetical protein
MVPTTHAQKPTSVGVCQSNWSVAQNYRGATGPTALRFSHSNADYPCLCVRINLGCPPHMRRIVSKHGRTSQHLSLCKVTHACALSRTNCFEILPHSATAADCPPSLSKACQPKAGPQNTACNRQEVLLLIVKRGRISRQVVCCTQVC